VRSLRSVCFVACGDHTELLDPGKEILDQMARRLELPVIVARTGWPAAGLPAAASGSRTRPSVSNALSAISVSAAIGLSTKIHALVDALGNPIGFSLTGGEAHAGSGWSAPTGSHTSPAPDRLVLTGFFWAGDPDQESGGWA